MIQKGVFFYSIHSVCSNFSHARLFCRLNSVFVSGQPIEYEWVKHFSLHQPLNNQEKNIAPSLPMASKSLQPSHEPPFQTFVAIVESLKGKVECGGGGTLIKQPLKINRCCNTKQPVEAFEVLAVMVELSSLLLPENVLIFNFKQLELIQIYFFIWFFCSGTSNISF